MVLAGTNWMLLNMHTDANMHSTPLCAFPASGNHHSAPKYFFSKTAQMLHCYSPVETATVTPQATGDRIIDKAEQLYSALHGTQRTCLRRQDTADNTDLC